MRIPVGWAVLGLIFFCGGLARAADTVAPLASALAAEGSHAEAALEFRRLALAETDSAARGGFFWAAAYEYGQARQWPVVPGLLDRAENDSSALKPAVLLLRGEAASAERNPDEAVFYWQSALENTDDAGMQTYLVRRLACEHIGQGDLVKARLVLGHPVSAPPGADEALARYEQGRDKSPILGGALGIVPGFGYAYSGEYANALRCLILNGIFIGAMVYSGMEDQWGAFAVISFFELTWFTGSIYGGVDSAHRYNRARREECLNVVRGGADYQPDFMRLPLVSLKFSF